MVDWSAPLFTSFLVMNEDDSDELSVGDIYIECCTTFFKKIDYIWGETTRVILLIVVSQRSMAVSNMLRQHATRMY